VLTGLGQVRMAVGARLKAIVEMLSQAVNGCMGE
jgi:hypothetical protein